MRRVLTVRGLTGVVLVLESVREEGAVDIASVMERCWPREYKEAVRFVGTDKPSEHLYKTLKSVLPQLECMFLDTVHVSMRYESANARSASPGLRELRRIMSKFVAKEPSSDTVATPTSPHTCFGDADPHEADEHGWCNIMLGKRVRHHITRAEAVAALTNLDLTVPYNGRKDFVYILACFAMMHRNELSLTGSLHMTLAQLLVNVAQPCRVDGCSTISICIVILIIIKGRQWVFFL